MRVFVLIVLFMGISACAWGGGIGGAVEVDVISDSGMSLPLYPVSSRPSSRKAYAEATSEGIGDGGRLCKLFISTRTSVI